MKNCKILFLAFILYFTVSGCENALEPETFDAIGPTNFWKTKADADAGMFYLYGWFQPEWGGMSATGVPVRMDLTTDELKGTRNDYNRSENFLWTSTQYDNDFYTEPLQMAVRANKVIDNLEKMESLSADDKKLLVAEARCLRAWYYAIIYDIYGPSVLELSAEPNIDEKKSRATEDEFTKFIIDELTAAANDLPLQQATGRMTKGAALMRLMKTYMVMTRFVDKSYYNQVAETAKKIMDLGYYNLQDSYERIWALDNEGNKEIIFAVSRIATRNGSNWLAHVLPAQYESPEGNPLQKWNVYRLRWDVYDTFDPSDKRLKTILSKIPVKDSQGTIIYQDVKVIDGNNSVGAVPFKYGEDPNINGQATNYDEVIYRYADVLLARAEALNEIQGPNNESITLINQVRQRAGLAASNLSEFSSKETFAMRILQERQWELAFEGVRRDDLIRHGLYAKKAVERAATGISNPGDTHFDRMPIPQYILDRNTNITQNPGY